MRPLLLPDPGRSHGGPSPTATHAEPGRDTRQGWGVATLPTNARGFLPFRPAAPSPRQAIHLAPIGNSSCRRPARVVDVDHTAPNITWVTDITYLWTREGWLYLAVI